MSNDGGSGIRRPVQLLGEVGVPERRGPVERDTTPPRPRADRGFRQHAYLGLAVQVGLEPLRSRVDLEARPIARVEAAGAALDGQTIERAIDADPVVGVGRALRRELVV